MRSVTNAACPQRPSANLSRERRAALPAQRNRSVEEDSSPGPYLCPMFPPRTVRLKDGRNATIRLATPDDAEGGMALTRAVTAERVFVMNEGLVLTPEEVRADLSSPETDEKLVLVAETDGEVVGQTGVHRGKYSKNRHTAELWIVVRKDWRGVGLGEALLRADMEWTRSVGIEKLKLGVFASNVRAIHLYRKLGFVEEGRLKDELTIQGKRVDDIQMALWLA